MYQGYVESGTHTKKKEKLKKIVRGKLVGIPRARNRQRKRRGRGIKRARTVRSEKRPGYKEVEGERETLLKGNIK